MSGRKLAGRSDGAESREEFTLGDAFRCAARGMLEAFASERNVKIDAVAAIAVVVLGFVLRVSALEWCVLLLCVALVVSLEMVNTAIETVVDLCSPEYHELARRAKDCAAGAVLFAVLCVCVVGLVIFAPHIVALIL